MDFPRTAFLKILEVYDNQNLHGIYIMVNREIRWKIKPIYNQGIIIEYTTMPEGISLDKFLEIHKDRIIKER